MYVDEHKRRESGAAPSVFEPEYQAVLDAALLAGDAIPTNAQNIINSNAITTAKALGQWPTIDAFYRFNYNDLGLLNFSLYNWVTAIKDLAIIGAPDYQLTGWRSATTSDRLVPSWKFNTLANFTQNDGFFIIRKDVYSTSDWIFGVNSTSQSILLVGRTLRWDIATTGNFVGGTRLGASSGALGSATLEHFENGVLVDTGLNDQMTITSTQPRILGAAGGAGPCLEPVQGLIIGGNGANAKANALDIHNLINTF